jgi:hypothetical protein
MVDVVIGESLDETRRMSHSVSDERDEQPSNERHMCPSTTSMSICFHIYHSCASCRTRWRTTTLIIVSWLRSDDVCSFIIENKSNTDRRVSDESVLCPVEGHRVLTNTESDEDEQELELY